MPRRIRRQGLVLLGALALMAAAPTAAQAVVVVGSVDLCAKEGEITLPGVVDPVPIWGFAVKPPLVDCSDVSVVAGLPGPVLEVTEDVPVTVNLYNELSEDVSLSFPGQNLIPDTQGAAPGPVPVSYTFTPSEPGTYLYESGTHSSGATAGSAVVQVPMGLYGALVVRPAVPNQAYGPSTTYDEEAVLVLSEIDTSLNTEPNPHDFNMLDYHPTYWLINGQAYDPLAPPAPISADAGEKVLLRYLNPGLQHHTMLLLGMHQRAIAKDAYPLPFQFDVVSETIPSGSTADMIATVPASAASADKFPLYSRSLYVTNGSSYPGGMLTFITVP